MSTLPDTWDELVDALKDAAPNTWTTCTAWAVGGGDPDGFEIRLQGGRATYSAAWCVLGTDRDRVRLSRLDPGPKEVARYVAPDIVVEVRRV